MGFNLGLRLRVTIGFAAMGCAIGFGFGGWLYVTSIELDQRLIEEALSAEVQDYRARLQRNPASLPPMVDCSMPSTAICSWADMPAACASFSNLLS